MSDHPDSDVDWSAVIGWPCPACGAREGEPCTGSPLTERGVPHQARVRALMEHWIDALEDRKARLSEFRA